MIKSEGGRRRALKRIRKALKKLSPSGQLHAEPDADSIRLTGQGKTWETKVRAGYIAAAFCGSSGPFLGTINDIEIPGAGEEREPQFPDRRDGLLDGRSFDVLIIGGGVVGAAVAQALARYDLSIALVEKESDLAMHASGRNDGMIHPGFAAKPGSRKAELNVEGNRLYDQLCRDLGIPFTRPGSMILFPSRIYRLLVPILKRRAKRNGVDGYQYLSQKQVAEMEPWFTSKQRGAFFLPSAGVLSPYRLVVALAEHAAQNGAEIITECGVTGFDLDEVSGREAGPEGCLDTVRRISRILTNRGSCSARIVINAAGIWSDWIAHRAGDRFFSLHGRKGVDAILDRKSGAFQTRIAAMPHLIRERHSRTKGGGLVPTIEGNILLGPTAKEVPFREQYDTDREDLEDLFTRLTVNSRLHPSQVITYFAGIRACTWEEDFIVRRSPGLANLIHLAGIQSPGLASAPAIALRAVDLVKEILKGDNPPWPGDLPLRPGYKPAREAPPVPAELSDAERDELIRRDPAYGRIVCRCEGISEGEIRDALTGPLAARTLDGVKRRCRAGTGRCHGGFCTPRILEIMGRELSLPLEELTKKGEGSPILWKETKGGR